MNLEQVKELIAHIENSKISKLTYKKGDFEVHLEKEQGRTVAVKEVPIYESAPARKEETAAALPAGNFVTSPMVGTFYDSPSPDQSSFVKVGDRVNENTVVCIIEAMKVMNEVKAGVSGTVAEVLVDSGHPVEFGTRLMRIT